MGPLVLVERFFSTAILFDPQTGPEIFRGGGGFSLPQPVYDHGLFTVLVNTGLERRDARTGRLLARYSPKVLSNASTMDYSAAEGYAAGGRSFIGAHTVGPGPGKRWTDEGPNAPNLK